MMASGERPLELAHSALTGAVRTLPQAAIDLGIKDVIRWFNRQVFNAIFALIELLFSAVLKELLRLDPGQLSKFESMYQLSTFLFFSLLTLFALTYLGMFQLFPENEQSDPYRFTTRALAALVAILIVNPPGSGSFFAQGAFAWAFEIANSSQALFLDGVSFQVNVPTNPANRASTFDAVGSTLMLVVGVILLLVVTLAQILLFVVLVARQVVIYLTYGMFPLLMIFWVADAGPLKYGKQLAEKLFKATGMLIPGGILIAAIFAVGSKFTSESITFAGGTAAASGGVDATFSTPITGLIAMLIPVIAAGSTSLLPVVYVMKMLSGTMGAAGQIASSVASGGKRAVSSAKGAASSTGDAVTGSLGAGVGDTAQTTEGTSGTGTSDAIGNTAAAPTNVDAGTQSGAGDEHVLDSVPDDKTYFEDVGEQPWNTDRDSDGPDPSEVGPDDLHSDMEAETLGKAYGNMSPEEKGQVIKNMLEESSDGQELSHGKKLAKEMMGPAGGAVGAAAVGALGIAGASVAGVAGTVAIGGAVTYASKRAIHNGSAVDGLEATYDGLTDLKDGTYGRFQDRMDEYRRDYDYATNPNGDTESVKEY